MASTDYTGFPISIPGSGGAFTHKLPTFGSRSAYTAAIGTGGASPAAPFDTGALTRLHLVTNVVTFYCIGYSLYPDVNPYCGSLIAYYAGVGDPSLSSSGLLVNYQGCDAVTVIPATTTLVPGLPLLTPNASELVGPLYSTGSTCLLVDGVHNDAGLVSYTRSLISYHPLKDGAEIIGSVPSYTGTPPISVPSYGMTVVTGSFLLFTTMTSGDTGGGTSFGFTSVLADLSVYFINLDGLTPTVFEVASVGTVFDSFTSILNAIHTHTTTQTIASQTVWVPQSAFPGGGVLPTRWMLAVGLKTLTYSLPTHDATLAGQNTIQILCRNNGVTAPQAIMGFDDGSMTYPNCIPS